MSSIKTLRNLEKLFINCSLLKERDLDKWFVANKISFTYYGDAIPSAVYSLGNEHEIKMYVNGVTSKQLISLILEALSGIVIFRNKLQERIFWDNIQKRMRDEFALSLPRSILPKDLFKLSDRDKESLKEFL